MNNELNNIVNNLLHPQCKNKVYNCYCTRKNCGIVIAVGARSSRSMQQVKHES